MDESNRSAGERRERTGNVLREKSPVVDLTAKTFPSPEIPKMFLVHAAIAVRDAERIVLQYRQGEERCREDR